MFIVTALLQPCLPWQAVQHDCKVKAGTIRKAADDAQLTVQERQRTVEGALSALETADAGGDPADFRSKLVGSPPLASTAVLLPSLETTPFAVALVPMLLADAKCTYFFCDESIHVAHPPAS